MPVPAVVKFHRDVYFPRSLEDRCLTALVRRGGEYTLTDHARQRAREKGVQLPPRIPFQRVTVIEATMEHRELHRFLIRFPQDDTHDIVMSVKPNGAVVTVYLNRRDDAHHTLDPRQYFVA